MGCVSAPGGYTYPFLKNTETRSIFGVLRYNWRPVVYSTHEGCSKLGQIYDCDVKSRSMP